MSDSAWSPWGLKDKRGALKLCGADQFDQHLIRDFGMPLLEGLMLEPLVKSERYEFLFVASALPIVSATSRHLSPPRGFKA